MPVKVIYHSLPQKSRRNRSASEDYTEPTTEHSQDVAKLCNDQGLMRQYTIFTHVDRAHETLSY